jgi:hypothetical protein
VRRSRRQYRSANWLQAASWFHNQLPAELFAPGFRSNHADHHSRRTISSAALDSGAESDLRGEVVWWQTGDFWDYTMFAAIAYIRAAADRAGVPVRQVSQERPQRA